MKITKCPPAAAEGAVLQEFQFFFPPGHELRDNFHGEGGLTPNANELYKIWQAKKKAAANERKARQKELK